MTDSVNEAAFREILFFEIFGCVIKAIFYHGSSHIWSGLAANGEEPIHILDYTDDRLK